MSEHKITTKKTLNRASSKSIKEEEPSSFVTVVGGNMTLNASKYKFY